MKKLTLMAIGLTAALAACANADESAETETQQSALAQPDMRQRMINHRIDKVLTEIDATDAQREQIHAVKDRMMAQAEDMHGVRDETRQAALAELRSDNPDSEKLHAMVDERVEDMRQMLHEAVDAAVEIHGTLTPEQRDELAQLIEEKMAEHEQKHR